MITPTQAALIFAGIVLAWAILIFIWRPQK